MTRRLVSLLISIFLLTVFQVPANASGATVSASYKSGVVSAVGTGFNAEASYTVRVVNIKTDSIKAMTQAVSTLNGEISAEVLIGDIDSLADYVLYVNNTAGVLMAKDISITTSGSSGGGGGGGGGSSESQGTPVATVISPDGKTSRILGTVTVTENSIKVTVSGSAFKGDGSKDGGFVRIDTDFAAITFDSKAVKEISGASSSGDVVLSVKKLSAADLSQEAKQAIGDNPVYDFTLTVGGTSVSDFGAGSAKISIPYTLKEGQDKNAVVVYYVDDSGKLHAVTGAYNESTKTVDFYASHFSKYAAGYNMVSFSDVSKSDWYYDAVTFIAARGITTGTSAGRYSPKDPLTRGQFIVFLMKAYGIPADENPSDNFADAGNTYYTKYLAKAKILGIANGMGNNLFKPESNISRQDMLTMLYRALTVLDKMPAGNSGKSLSGFSDSSAVSGYAVEAVEALVKNGVISGTNGRIEPCSLTNRAQMAQVFYNLLKV